MKRFLALALVMVLLLSLGACTSPAPAAVATKSAEAAMATPEPVELTMLHFATAEGAKTDAGAAALRAGLDKFIKDNPNITIKASDMSHDDYQVKIQAQAAANDMPDIYHMKGSWVENFVNSGLTGDLTPFRDALTWKNDFYPGEFDSCTFKGKIYGSPIQFVSPTSLVFYNAKLWKEAGFDAYPTTWDEVKTAAAKFKTMGISTISMGNKDKWPYESCWISTIGDRYTGTDWMTSIMARDGKAKFTDPDFISMLKFTADLGKSGILNPDYNSLSNQQSDDLYCQGKAASTIEGYWIVDYVLKNATKEVLDNTKIALLPQPSDATKGDKGSASGASGWFLAVNGKLTGAKLNAAAKVVFTILGPDYSQTLRKAGNMGTLKVTGVDDSAFPMLQQNYLKIANEYKAKPVYDVVLNGSIVDVMNAGLQEVLAGTKTPEDLAAEIQKAQEEVK